MKKWCHAALEREHSHILQGLTRGLASLATRGDLYRHVGRLNSLVSILEALNEPAEPTSHAQPQPSRELVLAQQLHQCAQVSPSEATNIACISPTFHGGHTAILLEDDMHGSLGWLVRVKRRRTAKAHAGRCWSGLRSTWRMPAAALGAMPRTRSGARSSTNAAMLRSRPRPFCRTCSRSLPPST